MKDLQCPLSWVPIKHSAHKWIWLVQHQHCSAQYQAQLQAWLLILSSGWREISWGDSLLPGGMPRTLVWNCWAVSPNCDPEGHCWYPSNGSERVECFSEKVNLDFAQWMPSFKPTPVYSQAVWMCASSLQNWGRSCWKTEPSSLSWHQDKKLNLCASAITWNIFTSTQKSSITGLRFTSTLMHGNNSIIYPLAVPRI